MKRLLAIFGMALVMTGQLCAVQPSGGPANIAGTLYASNFATWSVPQGNNGPFSWSSSQICTSATSGGISFQPFVVGSPIRIVDTANSALSENVVPSQVNISGSGCSITVHPANQHYSFYLATATAGLQDAINYANQSLGAATPAAVVILTPAWSQLGGTTSMITSAIGNPRVTIVDQRTSVSAPYLWSGTQYVFTPYGGGASVPPPSFAVPFANSAVTAFNADSTFLFNPTTHGLSAYLTNGAFNTDVAQTGAGNNGLANLEAQTCAAGGCTPIFPGTSGSTESPIPTVSNTHVQDFRKGSQGDYYLDPAVGGAGGYNPAGDPFSAARGLFGTWTVSTPNIQAQYGRSDFFSFTAPGWNEGTSPGLAGPFWSTQHGHSIVMSVATPGIGQLFGGQITKTAIGDSQDGYFYTYPDGGFTDGGGEGSTGIGIGRYQNSTWLHATANSGSTTGTQTLFATFTAGSTSRTAVSVGGYMLDITRVVGTQTITGPSTQLSGYAAWTFPVTTAHTESTAWGTANAVIPAPANLGQYQIDTVNFTVAGGTNAAGFVPGFACLNGVNNLDFVNITSVGTLQGGVQPVTFSHLHYNAQTGTSLWQGGPCGNFVVPFLYYLNGWTTAYPILGATDSTHLVGRFFTGLSQSVSSAQPIPNNYNANTVNVPLLGLSISGTTVTATFNGSNISVFAGLGSATISGATNSSFNGVATNITQINTNQLQWTQTGPTGTSSGAQITIPANQFNFYEIPGAIVIQPQMANGGIPLSWNNVHWTSGDRVENPFNPSFRGNNLSLTDSINNVAVDAEAGLGLTNSIGISVSGNGISGGYNAFRWVNNNALTLYRGDGGQLTAPVLLNFFGPSGTFLSTQYAPIDPYAPVIITGCVVSGNCSTTNKIRLWAVSGAGLMTYEPDKQEFGFNNVASPRVRASILSTGPGLTNTNPVAFTSGNSVANDSVLGTYAAVGNETPLDTSGSLGATAYYGANDYVGGTLPSINGVAQAGTPGSSTYSYVATCVTSAGEGKPSLTATTGAGNATLNGTNFNGMNITPGKGCTGTNVYRTAAPGGYSLGRICTNIPNNTANGTAVSFGCADQGQAAGPAPPSGDTSGAFQLSGSQALTSVQGTTGTKVLAATGTFTAGHYLTTDASGNAIDGGAVSGGVSQIVAGTGISLSPSGGTGVVTINTTGSGGGTVTTFSSGNAAPLFTTSVATPTNTPALSFTLSAAAQNSVFAGPASGGAGTPSYQTAPTFSAANLTNFPLATSSVFGVVKPDGTTCTTSAGVLTCPGTGGISGLTTGFIPLAASSTSIANSLLDYGVTTAGTFTFGAAVAFHDGSGKGGGFNGTEGTAPTGGSGVDNLWADSTAHRLMMNNNNGGATNLPGVATAGTSGHLVAFAANGIDLVDGGAVIANIQITLPTVAIAANSCYGSALNTAATATMTGLATTSTFTTAFATDAHAVNGWGGTGGLTMDMWPTVNTLNWMVCNQTASSITPGAMTLNVGAK